MRIIRFIIFLVAIFVIIFLISLLLPSKVTITKAVDINATPEKVAEQIISFEEWKNWYPAFKNENVTVIKNPSNANVISSVTLKDNKGKFVNLNIVDTSNHTIEIELPSSSSTKVNYQFIITPKLNNQTQLTWNVNANLGWLPWKKMEGIILDKFSGEQYKDALDNLKNAAEND